MSDHELKVAIATYAQQLPKDEHNDLLEALHDVLMSGSNALARAGAMAQFATDFIEDMERDGRRSNLAS